ncbi:MAG: hypothetical protein SFU83_23735 [Meiothermus sp.]|nr:hypothetical protein [Meiothermus sp.]
MQHWLHLRCPEDPAELRALARKALWLERRYHPQATPKDGT